jgi:hypothetical protein
LLSRIGHSPAVSHWRTTSVPGGQRLTGLRVAHPRVPAGGLQGELHRGAGDACVLQAGFGQGHRVAVAAFRQGEVGGDLE